MTDKYAVAAVTIQSNFRRVRAYQSTRKLQVANRLEYALARAVERFEDKLEDTNTRMRDVSAQMKAMSDEIEHGRAAR